MKVVKKILGASFTLALIFVIGFVFTQPQAIKDWWVLRNYVPSTEIVELAESTTLTDKATKLFYVYDPQIEPASEFNTHCSISEVSIILGCYDGRGIFVFRIDDERLNGVMEVTAAHELLHAAYDRLSEKERQRIDSLTARQLQVLKNERIQGTVNAYRARDPSVVPNELHSILATEVRDLDPELEEYYAQYFDNRLQIVQFSESYEKVFTELKSQVEKLDAELKLMLGQIDALEKDLKTRAIELLAQKSQLELIESTSDRDTYNLLVGKYNDGVIKYNSDLEAYKTLISEYNSKVAERNAISIEQNKLVDVLNSKAQEF